MGACATKPKIKVDDIAAIPAPEPVDIDMVKNTEEVKFLEEEKKEDNEKVVVEADKTLSLASFLVEKEAAPVVEVSSAGEKPKAEPPKEAAAPESEAAEEVKIKSEEKPKEKDEKSV